MQGLGLNYRNFQIPKEEETLSNLETVKVKETNILTQK
jgi:hypothetical protein